MSHFHQIESYQNLSEDWATLVLITYIHGLVAILVDLLVYTTGMPLFADCQKQSAKALKQVAKALSTAFYVTVGKEHVAKNSSAKKPLPPVQRKAVGKAFTTCQRGSRQRRRTPL